MAHHEKTGNNSTVTFAVVFALLFFFGVTVAANQYFVGSESADESQSVEHSAKSDDATADKHDESNTQEKHKPSKKKH